jgi:hypothetical protein
MTIKEVENRARRKILDTYEDSYRFVPIEVFDAIRDAVVALRSDRPESRYVDGILVGKDELLVQPGTTPESEPDKIAFEIPESFPAQIGERTGQSLSNYRAYGINMEDAYIEPIVYHVLHSLYLKDDPDTANATLSQTYYAKYQEAARS